MTVARRVGNAFSRALRSIGLCKSSLDSGNLVAARRHADAAEKYVQKYQSSLQTGFSEWVRKQEELGSSPRAAALSIHNGDWIVHQYRDPSGKGWKGGNIMLVEEKRFGSVPSFCQKDTLLILDRMLKERCEVRNERGVSVQVVYHGLYIMTFSGSGPEDSESITWGRIGTDAQTITVDQLRSVLRFDLDPATLTRRGEPLF